MCMSPSIPVVAPAAPAVQPTPVACPKPAIELFHMLCASQCGSVDLQTCNAAAIVDGVMTSARHHSCECLPRGFANSTQ